MEVHITSWAHFRKLREQASSANNNRPNILYWSLDNFQCDKYDKRYIRAFIDFYHHPFDTIPYKRVYTPWTRNVRIMDMCYQSLNE